MLDAMTSSEIQVAINNLHTKEIWSNKDNDRYRHLKMQQREMLKPVTFQEPQHSRRPAGLVCVATTGQGQEIKSVGYASILDMIRGGFVR